MLKKFVSSVMAVILLCGCGSSASSAAGATNESAADQASRIVSDLGLTDKMDSVEDRVVQGLFFFEDGTIDDSAVYLANDKTADVVGVFKTSDVDKTKSSVSTYLQTSKAQMQSYYPDEVFKIDNAVVDDNGSEVVLIVTDDLEKAKTEASAILGK